MWRKKPLNYAKTVNFEWLAICENGNIGHINLYQGKMCTDSNFNIYLEMVNYIQYYKKIILRYLHKLHLKLHVKWFFSYRLVCTFPKAFFSKFLSCHFITFSIRVSTLLNYKRILKFTQNYINQDFKAL